MIASQAQGVSDILVAATVAEAGPGVGWRVFISREPADPDTVITLYDTTWRPPNPKWLLDFPGVQVRVRGSVSGYTAARVVAQQVKDALLGIEPHTRNGDYWRGIILGSDITFLMYDQIERPIFTLNVRLFVEPAASAQSSRAALS